MSDNPISKLEEMMGQRREALDASQAALPPDLTDPLAQQSAAMMVEDLRTYLQAYEQVTLAATAKATALALKNPAAGKEVMETIGAQQMQTLDFAKEVTALATRIRASFGDGASAPSAPTK